jgi:hypothetical protein
MAQTKAPIRSCRIDHLTDPAGGITCRIVGRRRLGKKKHSAENQQGWRGWVGNVRLNAVRDFVVANPAVQSQIWPTGGHGNSIVRAHPEELGRLVQWLLAGFGET